MKRRLATRLGASLRRGSLTYVPRASPHAVRFAMGPADALGRARRPGPPDAGTEGRMTRTTLLVLGVVVTAGTVLETAPAAAQGGGRLLSGGSATVVVARSAGHARLAAAPRPPVAPAFRPLPAASKAALLKAAQEIVTAAP